MKIIQPKAFVIMPFAPDFDAIYEQLIKPPFQEEGYFVRRSDDLAEHQNILRDVVSGIEHATIIIADLSTLNPNVFYELGIAHAMGKPTVMLMQDISELPFDLRSYNVIPYSTEFDKAATLKTKLRKVAQEQKSGYYKFNNPVSDFHSKDHSLGTVSGQRGMVEELVSEDNDDDEELGKLDYLFQSEQAMRKIGEISAFLGEKVSWLDQRFQYHTKRIQELNANPKQSNQLSIRDRITREVSKDMIDLAKIIEGKNPELNEAWHKMGEGLEKYLESEMLRSEADVEAAIDFLEIIRSFKLKTEESSATLEAFAASAIGLKGITKKINQGANRLDKTVKELLDGFKLGSASIGRVITLLEDMIEEWNSDEDE